MTDVRKSRPHGSSDEGDARMVSLNFSVPARFRRELKLFATERDWSMVRVLYEGFQALSESSDNATERTTNRHIEGGRNGSRGRFEEN